MRESKGPVADKQEKTDFHLFPFMLAKASAIKLVLRKALH